MSDANDSCNLVENEVFENSEPAFPPAPPALQRPNTFLSPVQSQQQLPTAEGTPLRDARLKLAHRTEGLRTIILAFAVFSFGLTVALVIELFIGAPPVAPHGGVSCSSELCSKIAVEQLKKGGSAVDAAISAMLCIGVVRPQSAGLGGGGFMIVHDHKTHNSTLLDFRETAPKALPEANRETLKFGGLSVGVPGELAGMYKAHSLFGILPWGDLFTPVIKLAEDGWNLDENDRRDLQRRSDDLKLRNENYVHFLRVFPPGGGQARVRRSDLAGLYRQLAASPDQAMRTFYSGPLAEEIVETVQKSGGLMTLQDMKDYSVQLREPLTAKFRDFHIITFPAPSSGSLLVHMLNELDGVKTKEDVGTDEYYAKLARVTSTAYKCRALLGDTNNVGDREEMLINKTLDMQEYCRAAAASGMPPEDGGTSHINVIDNDEMLVSVTSSLNYWFGSMLMTPSGILLNNEMDDFDVASKMNKARAEKRPLSSMVPTIVYHETRGCLLRMAIGGTNGTKIPSSVVQTLMNIVVKGDDLPTAVEAPKIFCNATDCRLENFGMAENLAQAIREKTNLRVTIADEKLSTVGVVWKKNSTVDGYIETSSYGKAVTY